MFILAFIRKLYKVLSADASPAAIAFAVTFGVIAGCVPALSGLALFMLLLSLVFRVQLSAALLAWGLMRLASVAGLARLFESLGESLHDTEALQPLLTWLCNAKVTAWFSLESYAMLGGAVVGVLLGSALFLPVRYSIIAYRRFAHDKLSQNKFFKWLTSFWIVKGVRWVLVGTDVA